MEEFIKFCKEHNYDVLFNLINNKFEIEMIMTPKNFHSFKDLMLELDCIYLGEIRYRMEYDRNKGIRLIITPDKQVDKKELLENIMKIINELFEITSPELDYELMYRIMFYLRKLNVSKMTAAEYDEAFTLSIIHHKNIILPEPITKDNIVIKETKDNYERDTIHILEYKDLQEIVDKLYYPEKEPKKKDNIIKKVFKWK